MKGLILALGMFASLPASAGDAIYKDRPFPSIGQSKKACLDGAWPKPRPHFQDLLWTSWPYDDR